VAEKHGGHRDRALAAYSGLEQSAVLAVQVRSELANELGELPKGWTADSLIQPAEGVVAGDCYDLGLLNETTLYVIMIDVTGHGANAALEALKAKSQLRAALRSRLAPGSALDWLSRENRRDDGADLLTAVVATIDLTTGTCSYANAGHPPPIITDGEAVTMLGSTGPLVGAFPTSWETATGHIPPGSTLLFYTDGVTDAVGPDRERFGEARLVEALQRPVTDDDQPSATIAGIRDAIDVFRRGQRADDATAIALRRDHVSSAVDESIQYDHDSGRRHVNG
jgi:sigma-B regulation protein RsbU (phosphoserine phosphatase)